MWAANNADRHVQLNLPERRHGRKRKGPPAPEGTAAQVREEAPKSRRLRGRADRRLGGNSWRTVHFLHSVSRWRSRRSPSSVGDGDDGQGVAALGHAARHDMPQRSAALSQPAGLHRVCQAAAHIDRRRHGLRLGDIAFADRIVLLELRQGGCICAGMASVSRMALRVRHAGQRTEQRGRRSSSTAILDRLLQHSHVITIRGDTAMVKAKRTFGSPRNLVFLCPAEALTQPKTSSMRFRTLMLSA